MKAFISMFGPGVFCPNIYGSLFQPFQEFTENNLTLK
jgi:hypothetical protein